jgi:chromosome segregation ATPase
MTAPGDHERLSVLEAEVSALQARVGRVEDDASAARDLASGAGRDSGDLRTEVREFRHQNNRLLNAMRDDLTDLRSHTDGEFAEVRAEMRAGFAEMRAGFAEMRGRLDAAAAGHEQLARMLTVLIDREGGRRR